MSANNQPLSGNTLTPLLRPSLNSLSTNIILDSDSGNSSLLVQTGSITSLYIDKYANIGINTTSPGAQLEVASSNGACLRLRYGATSAVGNITMGSGGIMTLVTSGGEISTASSLNLSSHDGSTVGLKLNGILVAATASQLNTVSVTAGTAAADKALVLDSSRNITNINQITSTNYVGTILTASQPNITALGTIASLNVTDINVTGNLSLSGGSITTALSYLSSVTPGTATAQTVLVPDSSNNLSGLNILGVSSLTISGTAFGSTQLAYLTPITPGTASASKALILDSSRNIININQLTASTLTGVLQTAGQTNITSVGTLTSLTVSGATSITSNTDASSSSAGGALTVSGGLAVGLSAYIGSSLTVGTNLVVGGNLTVNGTTTTISTNNISLKDNIIVVNSGPSGSFDGGVLIQRYQTANNSSSGDVVGDTAKETTTASTGNTISVVNLSAGNASNNYYNGWWIKVGTDVRYVSSYTASTKSITVATNFSSIPSNGASVSLYNKAYASLVWSEAQKQMILAFTANDSSTTVTTLDYADARMGAITAGGIVSISDVTDSSSTTTGSLITAGGLGVSKTLRVGTGIYGTIMTGSQTNISAIGTLTNLTIGTATLTVTEAAYLTSITTGTASASKALVLDASSNISGINSLGTTTLVLGGTSLTSTNAGYISGLTVGTGSASKALVLDGSRNITNINQLIATSLYGAIMTASQTGITEIGTLTNLTIGTATLTVNEASYLTSITPGTASASKALVLNSSSGISGIGALSSTGLLSTTISNATSTPSDYQRWTNSTNTIVASMAFSNAASFFGTTSNHDLNLRSNNQTQVTIEATGAMNVINGLKLAGTTVSSTATELNYLAGITTGTATASKALVLNGSSSISGITSISTTTLVLGGNSLGATQSGYLTGITAGTASASKALVVDSSINLSNLNTLSFSGAAVVAGYDMNIDAIFSGGINKNYTTFHTFRSLTIAGNVLTNTVTAASGTDSTHQSTVAFNQSTIAASNTGVVTTNVSTVFIAGAPTAGTNMTITNAYALYVSAGTTFLGGTLSMNGTLFTSTQAGYLTSITAGTAAASKALVLDASSNITGINSLGTTTLVLGGNSLGATQSGYITGITAGTAAASKALVLDSSINITGINSLGTTTLVLGGNTLGATQSGYLIGITAGTASANKALVVDGSLGLTGIATLSVSTTLTLGGNNLGSTESGYLTAITAGTASASKALVLNASSNITSINSLGTATLVLGGVSLGATQAGYLSPLTAGIASAGKAVVLDSSSNVYGINALGLSGNIINASYSIACDNIIAGSSNKNYANSNRYRVLTCADISLTNTFTAASGTDSTHESMVYIGIATINAQNTSVVTTNASSLYIAGPPASGTNMTLSNPFALYVANGVSYFAGNINMNGTVFSSTQIAYLTSITPGTVSASKALVADSASSIAGIATLGVTTISFGSSTFTTTQASYLNSITVGTASASKALVLDGSSSIIGITSIGTTTLVLGGNSLTGTQAGYLTGITLGTASASKALVLDSSSNISGINSISTTSIVVGGSTLTGTQIGYLTSITAGTASAGKVLVVDGSVNISGINSLGTSTLVLGGTSLTSTQAGYLTGITAGSVTASKVMIPDGSSNITGLNGLAFGILTVDAAYNITSNSIVVGYANKNYSTSADTFRSLTCKDVTLTNTGSIASSIDNTHRSYVYIGIPTIAASNTNVTTTNASSLYIAGAPTSSTNMTLSNTYALYVASGVAYFTGNISMNGTTFSSTQAGYLSGITAGTASASKVLVLDSSLNISGINILTTTTLTLGATSIGATQAGYLTSITVGTASASKALVVDGSLNITGINSLGTTTLVLGGTSLTSTQAGYLTGITAGTASASKALVLDGSSNITSINSISSTNIILGGVTLTSTQAGYLTGITAGTASASKALVIDSSSNITSINSLGTTTLVLGGTSLTSTQANYLTGITTGTASASKALVTDSSTYLSGLAGLAFGSLTMNTAYSITGNSIVLGYANKNYTSSDLFRALTCKDITLTNTVTTTTDGGHQSYVYFGIPTIAASNTGVTTTNSSTVYIAGAPANGTNMTITNKYSLYVAGGTTYLGGNVCMGTSTDNNRLISALDANQGVGTARYITFGQSNSAGNQVEMAFVYAGSGSSSNKLTIGFYGNATRPLTISGLMRVGINNESPAEALDVSGNLKVTGNISTTGTLVTTLTNDATGSGSGGAFLSQGGGAISKRLYVGVDTITTRNTYSTSGGVHSYGFDSAGLDSYGDGAHMHLGASTAQFFGYNYSSSNYITARFNNAITVTGGGATTINTTCKIGTLVYVHTNNYLAIGTTNPIFPFQIESAVGTSPNSYSYRPYTGTGGVQAMTGLIQPVNISMFVSGRIIVGDEVDVLSDKRCKENIISLTDSYCLDFIRLSNPVQYSYKKDDNHQLHYGFIAQEVIGQGFGPGIVNVIDNPKLQQEIDPDTGFESPEGLQFVIAYDEIIPIVTKALQSTLKTIDAQQETINEQSDKILSLEARLEQLEKLFMNMAK